MPDLSDYPSLSTTNTINTMVLEDDFVVLKERIYSMSCNFEVIPIVGMGGIGKTTLARTLYEDSIKYGHFDRCIWAVVSQDYSPKKLFSEIMLSMGKPITDKGTGKEYTYEELKQLIYKELFGRRYIIVVDDLWSEKPWDDLNLILPKDTTGKVLVTTRLSEVAGYVGSSSNPPYEKQLLNEFQSWMLFEERVFGKGFSCPSELEQIGRKMVKSCRGLSLTIVVIAGLLMGDATKEYWESISENIGSSEPTIALHCSKVLSLSYNHLPLYLRPCFLYVITFPEDNEINVNRLIRLWMAEGFVKPSRSKRLEDVAEGYLHDLVGRSLLMASKKNRYNNRIKTIRIHDVLRDFGTLTAQQEIFHYHRDLRREYHRVTSYTDKSLSECPRQAIHSVQMPYYLNDGGYSFENLRLLRVWDACDAFMLGDTNKLVRLRYLSIPDADYSFLKSTSELRNIQTLIIQSKLIDRVVPLQLWNSPSLRHLFLPPKSILEQPSRDFLEETSLQTIRSVTNLRFTQNVLVILTNLRKLKVRYEEEGGLDTIYGYDLLNLIHLQKLEKLAINFSNITSPCFSDLGFPKSLKKLSLDNIDGLWKDMSVVGSLPNLQVFKLKWFLPKAGEWEPKEGQFLKLKHLKFEVVRLDEWEAESIHFPRLEILVLKYIKGLNEIPGGIGDIDTLKVIKLVDINKSIVDSAKQIQADQWEMGNQDLQLHVFKGNKYEAMRPEKH